MFQPINNPTSPLSSEYQIIEERLYEDLLIAGNDCNSPGVITAYIKEIPNLKIVPLKPPPSKLAKFRKAGLIGCLNDTGLTSKNYKNEIYKDNLSN